MRPVDQVAEDPAAAVEAVRVHRLLAVLTLAAGTDTGDDHPVANLEADHRVADLVDDPHALVTEDAAVRDGGHVALQDMEVRAADRRRCELHNDVGRRLDRGLRDFLAGTPTRAVVHECFRFAFTPRSMSRLRRWDPGDGATSGQGARAAMPDSIPVPTARVKQMRLNTQVLYVSGVPPPSGTRQLHRRDPRVAARPRRSAPVSAVRRSQRGAAPALPWPRPDEPACRQTALRRWRPSANSSMIFELKAGRSAGRRLETRPLSLRTSSSTQRAPAFWRSVRSVG